MSNAHQSCLPPEILDYIVDHLHDKPKTLKQCCLVSKSWVPRTRKHLFGGIEIFTLRDLKAWKKAFPDPSRSPVHYTHTLMIDVLQIMEAANGEEGNWIPIFFHVLWSGLNGGHNKSEIFLAPCYRFSSSLKSLRVATLTIPHSQIFNLIWSLPLLENLTLIGRNISTIECVLWFEEDLRWMAALLAGCPGTLECLDIERCMSRTFPRLLRWASVPDWNFRLC